MNTRLKTIVSSGALLLALVSSGTGMAAMNEAEVLNGTIRLQHQSEAAYPALARIDHSKADQLAVTAVPGAVLKSDLKEENGFLVYEVEVVQADQSIANVLVDAGSGQVLAHEIDAIEKHDGHRHHHGHNDEDDHGEDNDNHGDEDDE